jgi:uncharacterized protein (DUF2237 family)
MTKPAKNVLGTTLETCCTNPMTGWQRNGRCETDKSDLGRHVVCAEVTAEFLEFSGQQGNDLTVPSPESGFPGLKPGDCWCLCAARWKQALEAGVAPRVRLSATEESALELVSLEELSEHALDLQ